MLFRYPSFQPSFATGLQINNPGQGGPSGNPAAQMAHPQSWPGMTGHLSGLFVGPTQYIGKPQMPVNNNLAAPSMYMEIPGIMKTPSYG